MYTCDPKGGAVLIYDDTRALGIDVSKIRILNLQNIWPRDIWLQPVGTVWAALVWDHTTFLFNLVIIQWVVSDKQKMLTDDARRTTHENGHRPVIITPSDHIILM